MINVHILCSNYPPSAATNARSLFRHSAIALTIMRWSSLSDSGGGGAVAFHKKKQAFILKF